MFRSPRRAASRISITVSLVAAPLTLGAADYEWDGDCADGPPHRWHCRCSEPDVGVCNWGSTTNWDPDGIPGPGDNATIPPGSGMVRIDNNTTVNSVNAGSGLKVDYYDLTIEGAGSSIEGLELTHQGWLMVSQIVDLIGPSQVKREVWGPGTLVSNGPVDLSNAYLRQGVLFRNQGSANVTSANIALAATLENEGSMTLASNRDIESLGLFKNSGQLTYAGPGTEAYFDPKYAQTGGSLKVQGGELHMRSTEIDLEGGGVNIAAGAKLIVSCPWGGTHDHRFNGIGELTGGGTLELVEPMTVAAPVVSKLGSGDPWTGTGGFLLRSTLTLDDDLTNGAGHRMRFSGGKLVAETGAIFSNKGVAFTYSTGNAIFEVSVWNEGNFFLLGPGVTLEQGAIFYNEKAGTFKIVQGDVSQGSGMPGMFMNRGVFSLETSEPNIKAHVSTIFENEGTVVVKEGELHLQGAVNNLFWGILAGGTWRVEAGGLLDFPGAIHRLEYASVEWRGNGQIPDLASLADLTGESVMRLSDGADISFDNRLTVSDGSDLEVELGSSLSDSTGLLIGDPDDSVVPELSGIVTIAKSAGGQGPLASPPLITTPTLENDYGRVLPTERHRVGTMQLVGDFIQGPDGSLNIDVSTAGGDVLQIDGDAVIDGTLELKRLDSVVPGTEFTILTTTGVVSGTFAEITAPDLYSLRYQTGSVTVTFEEKLSEIFSNGFESGRTVQWSSVVP